MVCPRCNAPLYPGHTRCGNCGFDSAQPAWAPAPAVAAKPAGSNLPILLAIGGVLLLAGAGVVAVLATSKSGSASASPAASTVAQASPRSTLTPLIVPAATDTPAATPKATATPTAKSGTPEPLPLASWTTFTAPDGKWSVDFPSTMTPLKQTMPLNSGLAQGDMTMYMVADGSTAYAMVYFDFPTGTIGTTSSTFLKLMESSMMESVGGTLVTSSDAMVGTYPARDLTIDKSGQTVNLRVWFVGDRFYMAMVMAPSGSVVYPQHFVSTVVLG